MSCLLRAEFAEKDQLEVYLGKTTFKDITAFRRGELRFPSSKNPKKVLRNGINIRVSNADFFDFRKQVRDATRFLIRHTSEVRRLRKSASRGSVFLDFAIGIPDSIMTCYRIPEELSQVCSSLGLDIEISQYAMSSEKSVNETAKRSRKPRR